MRPADAITAAIDRFYVRPVAAILPLETFRYAACGGMTYVLFDPACYFLIYNYIVGHRFFDLGFVVLSPHIAALALVFPLTFFVGFWLNRNVAFRRSPLRTRTQLWRYALSIGGSLLLTYAVLKFFVEVCGVWPTPAKVLTTCVTTVYSYLAAKYFTFRMGRTGGAAETTACDKGKRL
ncbi:MAG: GtrA family protein [Alistipes sp.]|nr:GtrA family protein [Alistipes sp.]